MTEFKQTASSGGEKNGKPEKVSLIPPEGILESARVYGFGAQKYADHNWRKGYQYSWSLDALGRHIEAYKSGENNDPQSTYHHLAHAIFHCMTLITYDSEPEKYAQFDDRYKG